MEIWATVRQEPDGRWSGRFRDRPPAGAPPRLGGEPAAQPAEAALVTAPTREECVRALERLVAADRGRGEEAVVTLIVEVAPLLAGVAEAAEVMGWDKRRVITYLDRGRFPPPLQSLASGRVWMRQAVEEFATEWRLRQARRGAGRPGGVARG